MRGERGRGRGPGRCLPSEEGRRVSDSRAEPQTKVGGGAGRGRAGTPRGRGQGAGALPRPGHPGGQPWGQMWDQGLKPNFTAIEQERALREDENRPKSGPDPSPARSQTWLAPSGPRRIAPSDFRRLSVLCPAPCRKQDPSRGHAAFPTPPFRPPPGRPGPRHAAPAASCGPSRGHSRLPSCTCSDSGPRGRPWLDSRSSLSPSPPRHT